MKDLTVVNSKWIEMYFGLFGPCLTYHTSRYKDDTARLVLSLILIKMYFTLPWSHRTDTYEKYGVYGFYTDGYPARIVFQWGNFCNVYIMPWEWVCVSSILLDKNGNLFGEDFDESCGIHGSLYGYEFDYYVTKNTYQRKFAKHFGNMCTMEMYGVNVTFDKEVNGCKKLNFLVPYKSLITDQIHLNILSTLPPY